MSVRSWRLVGIASTRAISAGMEDVLELARVVPASPTGGRSRLEPADLE